MPIQEVDKSFYMKPESELESKTERLKQQTRANLVESFLRWHLKMLRADNSKLTDDFTFEERVTLYCYVAEILGEENLQDEEKLMLRSKQAFPTVDRIRFLTSAIDYWWAPAGIQKGNSGESFLNRLESRNER